MKATPKLLVLPLLAASLALTLGGCASPQSQATTLTSANHLKAADLRDQGLAFITSSSITGQEEDKQAMALSFANVMHEMRPQLRIMSQAESLSAINRAGLANEYRKMLEDYAVTGILNRATLREVARVTGARYVAQLKLSGFKQEAKSRFSALGLRLVETQVTVLRLFLQIWDSEDGSIVWEGGNELSTAHDSTIASTVAFKTAIEEAARNLIDHLPGGTPGHPAVAAAGAPGAPAVPSAPSP